MTSLYEISQEYKNTFDIISDFEGVSEEIIENTLSGVKSEFNHKAINIVSFFKNLEADTKAIKDAEDKMRERRKIMESKIERLKDYLKSQMMITGITKIKCPYFEVSISKTKSIVEILDFDKIPKEFIVEKTTFTPDKNLIHEAGGCEGAVIKENYALRIK